MLPEAMVMDMNEKAECSGFSMRKNPMATMATNMATNMAKKVSCFLCQMLSNVFPHASLVFR